MHQTRSDSESPTPGPSAPPGSIARTPDQIRAWIVDELSAALKRDAAVIDTAAPLDSLGIDSLVAFTMTGELARYLGRDLPATLVWEYPTIDALAEGLGDPAAEAEADLPGVLPMRSEGTRTPVFFLPGLGGHPMSFMPVAKALGDGQPSFGLTTPGVDGATEPLETVEEIGDAMIANMRRVQPSGPYHMVGYSFGGLLAYEMARKLTAAGEAVGLVGIVDTFTPDGRVNRPAWQRAFVHARVLITRPGRIGYLKRRLRRSELDAPDVLERDVATAPEEIDRARLIRLVKLNRRAVERYRPGPYDGGVLLFQATERSWGNMFMKCDPLNGWAALAAGGVDVVKIGGLHNHLLAAVNASAMAEALSTRLRSA